MTRRFCCDCQFYLARMKANRLIPPMPPLCTHPAARDVIGDPMPPFLARSFGQPCGEEARLFSARRPDPPPGHVVTEPGWRILGVIVYVYVLAVIVAALIMLAGCTNRELQIAYHAANIADGALTVTRDPRCMQEGNPILGQDPSDKKVWLYIAGTGLIYEWLCSHRAREAGEQKACRIALLGIKIGADAWNLSQHAKGCD